MQEPPLMEAQMPRDVIRSHEHRPFMNKSENVINSGS
jgi:hypothetical protein